ncbi:protein transport protein Sec16B [Xiphophorus hellerii]|uniref:protein transport protein Sec16B n=1 Tax=Xiphophorus hellerii TaxID=8084 RepID=UPI0013B38687|nr:protein transport protein Sec16B-like [Xiphophorus hellerii]XP_032428562.1 protein transport protein Sec16B-like [Xiphophorus hellerii]XP_032428563.1 protein transport protein Sec16B-like [Xiphophorus hellerii]XP_032428564.1 protein transport protein Sec16B-like [Xiphophorus hellerii]
MYQRGHQVPDSGHRSHRQKDKEHYSRSAQQERDLNYPMPDQHWDRPDARYMSHFTSPPARPQLLPYNSQEYAYGYGWQEHHRPQSRHGYDYSSQHHWDYRDGYGYYDYYRGHHAQQDGVQWGPQESWQTNQLPDRTHMQGHGASLNSEEHRYDQRRDISQRYLSDYEANPSRDNEEISSYHPGTLESSKTSGLSSSSYELSQYMNGSDVLDSDMQPVLSSDGEHPAVRQTAAPLKYSVPHTVVSFGPVGQLIRVTPALSAQEKSSRLEIHSLELILSETQEQQEMRNFPGPLTREDLHKVDAIDFAHQKAGVCMRDGQLADRSSAALLWNLLILLCRQNGQIVGSDIAELLMQDSHSDGSWKPDVPTLIDFDEHPAAEAPPAGGDDLLTGDPSSSGAERPERALQSYTQLLLAGRKKEALESAMSSGLWGHALFLASKMGSRSYTTVLNRFTSQLVANDPLQTLFQLLSGRIPAASACCGNEKWGDWRPHLAVMLSNETGSGAIQQKAILTMGDSLASRGLTHAAHVCYLTAAASFGLFPQKAERLVLLGSSHRQPFGNFASNSAIQCTELYEYCQTLGGKSFSIPSFQVYKFLYASRLLDCGLSSQAFHYCEVVGQAILRQQEPHYVLMEELIKLSDRLRFSEGQYSEAGFTAAEQEPEWLKHLRTRHQRLQMGIYDGTDINQAAPANHALADENSQLDPESDLDDLSCHYQNPEPEFLYFQSSEHQESLIHGSGEETQEVMSNIDTETQQRPHADAPSMPTIAVHAPSAPAGQNFSHHYTDGVEARSSMPHCPLSNVSLAADEADSSSRTGTMLEVSFGHNPNQQVVTGAVEEPEGPKEVPKQSTKAGWFSGWFKSKPKEVQENTEKDIPAQTDQLPVAGQHPPPPPAALPAATCPASPAGMNPFSRRAGLQPR